MQVTREEAKNMAQAHAEGYHTEPEGLPREGCPECEDRPLRDYPYEKDLEKYKIDPIVVPLWLPAAVYRVLADPQVVLVNHRNALAETFNDFPRELIDQIVDALIEYGCVCEVGETAKAHGDLSVVPYDEETA